MNDTVENTMYNILLEWVREYMQNFDIGVFGHTKDVSDKIARDLNYRCERLDEYYCKYSK